METRPSFFCSGRVTHDLCPFRNILRWNQKHIWYQLGDWRGIHHSWTKVSVCLTLDCSFSCNSRWSVLHAPLPSLFLSHPRGQGWFPVILAFSVYVCCSISTSIKLFLSCSAVTESTARDCRPRGLGINHTDCARLSVCVGVHVCVNPCVTGLLCTSHHRIWRTFVLSSWPRKCQ